MTAERRDLGSTWVFGWQDARTLGIWFAVMVVVYVTIGEIITRIDPLVEADQNAAEWFERNRTAEFDTIAPWAAGLSDTLVKVIATSAIVVTMLAVWRRWLEPLIVGVALVLEATTFIVVTYIVGRPRPKVERLQESPVDSSFPSGHVAAAAAYFAIAAVLCWHVGSRTWRAVIWTVPAAITIIVAIARLYQGMHFVTDVILGVLLGLWSVVVAVSVLRATYETETDDPVNVRDVDRQPGVVTVSG